MVRHTITMPETMSEFMSWDISEGNYSGVSEYIRNLVRREQERKQASIEALRKMIDASEASGISHKSMEEIRLEVRKELGL